VISNFTMAPPPVSIKVQKAANSMILSWPASTGAYLKATTAWGNPSVWADALDTFRVVGNDAVVTVTPLVGTPNRYFRLEVYP
jgi:hypothetical protein